MRTIKFRGYSKDFTENEWFFGNLIDKGNGSFQILEKDPKIWDLSYDGIGVLPESVGQFTGLHDKNGKEIYEGDIVSYKRNVGNWTGKSLTTIHEIIFTEEINAFVMKDNSGYIKLRKHWGYEYEVIGNIYENA